MKKLPNDWKSGRTKPDKPAVYEIAGKHGPWFRYWDGKRWHPGWSDPETAIKRAMLKNNPDGFFLLRWREIKQQPKATKSNLLGVP